MTAIITGDIINSRNVDAQRWIPVLKKTLNEFGKTPTNWEIYRGDSFQIEVNPINALKVVFLIKSTIKQLKSLDVRMAIGIGDKSFNSKNITESNGSAYINSGEAFERLRKKTLSIRTIWNDFDKIMNIMLDLVTLTSDNWTPISSLIIKTALESNKNMNQEELASLLNKSQGNISEGLNRGGFYEMQKLLNYYQQEMKNRC